MKTNHIILPEQAIELAEISTIKYGKILTVEIGIDCNDSIELLDLVVAAVESVCNQRSVIVNDVSGTSHRIWITISFVDSLITGIVSTLDEIFRLLEIKPSLDLKFLMEGACGKLKKLEEKQLSLIEEEAPSEH